MEFTQVLQDMIGDLSNAPEPIQIKIFASNPALLNDLGPRIGDAIAKIDGVVDIQNGIDNTISGPATELPDRSWYCGPNGLHSYGDCGGRNFYS